jgi:hypothetical protein
MHREAGHITFGIHDDGTLALMIHGDGMGTNWQGHYLGVGSWPTARDGRLFSYGIIGYAASDTMQLHLARGEALQSM